MTKEQFWNKFIDTNPEYRNRGFLAYSFWGLTDRLARLVINDRKTATVSSYNSYIFDGKRLPKVGDISMILDSNDEPVVLIENTEVEVRPFSSLDEKVLVRLGERSHTMWLKVQENYFRSECQAYGIPFTEDFPVVVEIFRVLYKG